MSDLFVSEERIESRIYAIRGQKIILDSDLAVLYGVKTKVLNQAVTRHLARFPGDFMFELTLNEAENLKSQSVTSSFKHGGKRKATLVFTEQGVAMLSSILKSERAIAINIQIIRTFTRLRYMIAGYNELRLKVEAMEKQYDGQFQSVFEALRGLLVESETEENEIGFRPNG